MRRKAISTVIAVIGILAAAADMMLLFAGRGSAASPSVASGTPLGSGTSGSSSGSGKGTSDSAASDGGSGSGADSDSGTGSTDDSDDSDGSDGTSSDSGAFKDGVYTGAVVATSKGDVQVQVTVADGKVTQVAAVKYPSDNPRSLGIAQQAIPQLSDEAVKAQSADIQMVSGATETSTGFIGSLQDALDQAK